MSERFTVVGSRGFIGRSLAEALRLDGHDVRSMDRLSPVSDRSLGHVIFAAGVTADYRTRPVDTMEAHVGALADLLTRGGFDSLTYLSSTRVYEGLGHGHEDAVFRCDPADPSQLYNISKLAGEALCLTLPDPQIRVVRLSNVFGAADRSETLMSALLHEARDGNIHLQSAAHSAKDFIFIDDVTRLLPQIRFGRHRTYNLAAGRNVEYGDIVRILSDLSGAPYSVSASAPVVSFPEIDVSRLQAEFGFMATPLEEALTRTWETAGAEHHD